MDPLSFLVFTALIFSILYLWSDWTSCNLPGPWGIPLLGYFPFLKDKPYLILSKLAKRYGEIYQLKIGIRRVVILNTHEVTKELMNDWDYCNRPATTSFRSFQNVFQSGVAFFSLSKKWFYLRKTATRSVGLFVTSSNSCLEEYTQRTIDYMTGEFSQWPKEGAYPKEVVFFGVSSIVGSLCYGKEFKPNDPLWVDTLRASSTFSKVFGIGAVADYLPFLKPFVLGTLNYFGNAIKKNQQYLYSILDSRKENLTPGNRTDVRDIQEALEATTRRVEEYEKIGVSKTEIRRISFDLFNAGTFTTLEHFLHAIRVLAVYPEVQKELRNSVNKVVDLTAQYVTIDAKERAPYAKAFLEELFRFMSHVPLGISHATTKDVVYKGFRIPKDTIVIPNLWLIHHDSNLFPEPQKFDVSRFLDESGQYDGTKAQYVSAFGSGKRKCVGEVLARKELFLLISNIVRRFEIGMTWTEGSDPFDHGPGFVKNLKPAGMTFKLIKEE